MTKKMIISFTLSLLLSSSNLYAVQSTKVNYNTMYKVSVIPKNMTVQEKKQRFRDLVVPVVEKVYADLYKQYKEVSIIVDSGKTNTKIEKLIKSYHAKNSKDLLKRLKPHAKSVAIAQAAMESSWATSRFTLTAKNLFGVWSFNKNEPRVAAGQKRGNKTIYVKKYPTIEASIKDYYKTLATGKIFKEFRNVKMATNNPYELVKKLDKYSEKGTEYPTFITP